MAKRTGIYKRESGVYRIQNMITGKIYIGSSNDIYKRIGRHKYVLKNGLKENIRMKEDFDNFGINSFIFGIVEYCEKENLKEREQFYFDLWKPQYNVWKTIYNAKNREYTTEQLAHFKTLGFGPKDMKKHSESLKQAWIKRKEKYSPEELFQKMSKARIGFKHSEETIQKYRETRKGKLKSAATKEKMRLARLGSKLINGKYIKENIEEKKRLVL